MRRLTIKQRAQRATNRINKVVAVKYPLLAEQLSTTVAEQEQRIAQKDDDAAKFARAFWAEIGAGNDPDAALNAAFVRAPSGMEEYVERHW